MKNMSWRVILDRYSAPFLLTYSLVLITYSYLFTTIIFTNHTFPNILLDTYPTPTTYAEGRWFGDIIRLIVGTSGVQSFQMFVGVGIQIINAFIFAEIINVKDKVLLFLIAAFLSLHPIFLDYYSFIIDHISYTLGDSLALLGVLVLSRQSHRWKRILMATCLFTLCIATYQPKIGLIATLLVVSWIQEINGNGHMSSTGMTFKNMFRERYFPALLSLASAVIIYLISINFVITAGSISRNQINNLGEILAQISRSYYEVLIYFTDYADYLPVFIKYLPLLCILSGVLILACRAYKKGWSNLLWLLVLLTLLPVALRSTYAINSETWSNAGRVMTPYAYCLIFFISLLYSYSSYKKTAITVTSIFIYFFLIVGIQTTNEASIKTIFEFNKINRIITRIESTVPDLYQNNYGLIVVGQLNMDNQALVKMPLHRRVAHVRSNVFEDYRQVEILNFYLGKDILVRASKAEHEAILPTLYDRRPWPAGDSVFETDGVIVVLLERYTQDKETTWYR